MEQEEQQRLAELVERETAYGLFQRASALLKSRHHAQAAVLLERADRLEPGKGSIVEALARAYYNSRQHERAAQTFAHLVEIDPSTAYGHFGLGQSLKQLGRTDEARTHLRLAVALAPDSSLYRNALARLPAAPRRRPMNPRSAQLLTALLAFLLIVLIGATIFILLSRPQVAPEPVTLAPIPRRRRASWAIVARADGCDAGADRNPVARAQPRHRQAHRPTETPVTSGEPTEPDADADADS